ncbi:hypothetical protein KCH_69610 [Kitasatospora cheerisanensis KCTC 2395]|uniref:Uncharacterized protein n=1 Tax=Kitasatospora cheerisanensis KCTC 2395 TaxID=1348663 RepID=A0A066YN44_9ACTN|nr:hypothetical protein KCH_69610 [Kitasatospora cheerisanensis KCTC 2395]
MGELYVLTHAAAEEFYRLGEAFEEAGSKIGTVARDRPVRLVTGGLRVATANSAVGSSSL